MKPKMQRAFHSFTQILVMAAIVTTLLCLPVGALLAAFCYAVLDIPFQTFLTFAGTFDRFVGLLAWWMLLFVPALAYAAYVLPWHADEHRI
jgi:hypothetical protein